MPGRNRTAAQPAKFARQPRTRERNPKESASRRQPARIPLPTPVYSALQPKGLAPSLRKSRDGSQACLAGQGNSRFRWYFSTVVHKGTLADITHGCARSCVLFKVKLELVLPLAQRRENSGRVAHALAQVLVRRFDDRGCRHPQEGVGRLFASDRRRQRRAALALQLSIARLALEQRGVARLDGLGEADVRQRVFVSAIDERFVGQRRELLER